MFYKLLLKMPWRDLWVLGMVFILIIIAPLRKSESADLVDSIKRIEVHPPNVDLANPRDIAQLVVTGFSADTREWDLTHLASYEILGQDPGTEATNAKGVAVEHGLVSIVRQRAEGVFQSQFVSAPGIPAEPPRVPSGKPTGQYDLAADFSNTQNPHDTWSYERIDGTLLNFATVRLFGSAEFPAGDQPGWHSAENASVPAIARAVSPKFTGTPFDFPEQRVFCHTPIAIAWTAPHAGTVSIDAALWMPRDIDRVIPVTLHLVRGRLRQVLISSFNVPERDSNNDENQDGPTSDRPYTLAQALSDSKRPSSVLRHIQVMPGDQLRLEAKGGDFLGVDWKVQFTTSVPTQKQLPDTNPNDEFAKAESIARPAATIRVTVGDNSHEVPVLLPAPRTKSPISFRDEVLVAISKQGCNSGSCHASPNGKGGFHLSLRGFDTKPDWQQIVFGESGRRVNLLLPETSLLLRKPLMDVAHGGGRRLHKQDLVYSLLRDWIANGCQADAPTDPECIEIEVHPNRRVLYEGSFSQQLAVLAKFNDGRVRDVTQLATFTSSDDQIAEVNQSGRVIGHGRGQSAIMVQYGQHMQAAWLSWIQPVAGFQWNEPPENNYVDHLNFAQLQQFQILPSELCTDDEFIRRLYLDILGKLPSVRESKQFLKADDPAKRRQLVDHVLERPEFAEFWGMKWADLLRVQNRTLTPPGVNKFHRWIVNSIADNQPFDEFVHRLLTGSGSVFSNPPTNFYRTTPNHEDCAETTAELFLGVKIKCAKCHNHPFDRWTQDNYHGLAALFHRVGRKQGTRTNEIIIFSQQSGELAHPKTGQVVPPWLPGVGDLKPDKTISRREHFARWLTDPENPYLAAVAVNRIWYHLFGRGLVEPIDDFRDSNPATNPALLTAMASDFVKHSFDRKQMIRTILNSRTYQLSAVPHEFNADDLTFFSRYRPRRLSAEQLMDAISQVTLVPETFPDVPQGTRVVSRPSPLADNSFLSTFGQPERNTACQCEREVKTSFAQALQLANGHFFQAKLQNEQGRVQQRIAEGISTKEILQELYWSAYCRAPTDHELSIGLQHIDKMGEPLRGLQDCCWALVNSQRFVFEH